MFTLYRVTRQGNMTEPEKRYLRRVKLQVATKPNPNRKWLTAVKPDFVPCKPRGRSHCRLNHVQRVQVLEKAAAREKFIASLKF